jgi:hypothetical protein
MNITLGVYDLFAYAAPGSLYLALIIYVADRLAWVDPMRLFQSNTTLIIIAGLILSYLLGHITYGIGKHLSRAYRHGRTMNDARRTFVERVPAAKGRPFVNADGSILQAAVEAYETGASGEIARLRAVGLMLRNSAPVFILGAVAQLVDALTGHHVSIAVCCIISFPLVALACLHQSSIMLHRGNMKTLELAYWVPDIDRSVDHEDSSSQEVRNSTASVSGQSGRKSSQSPRPQ